MIPIPQTSPITVRISATSDRVRVIAEARDDVMVEGDASVLTDGTRTTIESRGHRIVVLVPEGADLVIGTTSGRVDIDGRVGSIAVVTESGRITVAEATSADIRTRSARVEVGRTSAECCVRSTSGRVTIGKCGSAEATTTSGRIVVHAANGPVRAHCVSGRVEVGLMAPGSIDAETVSGEIRITVPAGVGVLTNDDLSVRTMWPDGVEASVNARTVSGRVDVSST